MIKCFNDHFCPFCKSALYYNTFTTIDNYQCNECTTTNLTIAFTISKDEKIQWHSFLIGDYQIYTAQNEKMLLLYHKNAIVVHLRQSPTITPINAKQWLDKLLNLKSFS